jgi:hypothetical protein
MKLEQGDKTSIGKFLNGNLRLWEMCQLPKRIWGLFFMLDKFGQLLFPLVLRLARMGERKKGRGLGLESS